MPLAAFSSVDPSVLRWLRDEENPMAFTLTSGETAIAKLHWARHGGSLASAETSTGTWTLKRGGFLNPHVTVRLTGEESDIARISAHLSSHRIQVRGGATYRFHRAGFLVPAWTISTEDGREILHIEPVRQGRKLEGGAVLSTPEGIRLPDLLLLAVAGWYFIVLAWFEDEALVPLEGAEYTAPTGGGTAPVSGGSRGS